MPFDPERHHRHSIRLRGHDYSMAGAYFVTICTQGRVCLFGDIVDGDMRLSDYGQVIADGWDWLGQRHSFVELDAWTVMPNHLHGILLLTSDEQTDQAKRKPLGRLIGAFKTVSTKRINDLRGTPGETIWQRSFYDHIIRNETAYDRIYDYIVGNAQRWESDQLHPDNPSKW